MLALVGCTAQEATPEPPAAAPPPVAPVATSTVAPAPLPTASVSRGEAGGLKYIEVVPAGVSPDARLPMVVFIHGLGDRPRRAFVADPQVAARFILPQAPLPYGRGFSWFDYRVGQPNPDLANGIARAAEQLAEMLSVLRRSKPTAGLPIITGFSQGGMLSYALALHHPDQVLAAHPISGMLPPALWPQAPAPGQAQPPIRAVHGTADQIVSYASARTMVDALEQRGFDISLQAFEGVGHTQSPGMRAALDELLTSAVLRTQNPLAPVK